MRYGYVIRVGGDPEISGAIAEGMLATSTLLGRQEGLTAAQRREIARLVKVAIGNTKTPEDYTILCMAAEQEYRTPRRTELHRAAELLLVGWTMMCYGIARAFKAQDKVLERRG
jgi:hypothetical protein